MEKKIFTVPRPAESSSYGGTKGNTKPPVNAMPQSGGPKTPPSPKGTPTKESK